MSECPYCQNTFEMQDTCSDEFRMWQGLQGPYYSPTVDEEGVLSWTNTGGLPNPDPVDISGPPGKGLTIKGVVATVGDLPANPEDGDTYLVGATDPYDGYIWLNGTWVELGDISKGEAGEGVPTGGTTGQVLAKASGADYDTEWVNQSAGVDPATANPIMDGTAAVGVSTKYAREDHVHPVYNQIVRPNLLDNWYFVGGGSQLGSGIFPINQRGQTSYTGSAAYSLDRWVLQYDTNLQVLSAGTKISGKWDIKQKLKSLPSGIYTVSVLLSDYQSAPNIKIEIFDSNGTSITQSFTNNNGLITKTMSSANVPATISLNLSDSSGSSEATIIAIKLELGTTQTLAHQENGVWVLNEIPDYSEQLYRCCASLVDSSDIYANKPYNISFSLLWSNASPTSSFAAQTVSINLTDYSFILIGINGWDDDTTITYQTIRKGDSAANVQFRNAQITATCAVFQRNISVSDSGVNFGDCIGKGDVTSTSPTTANSGLVPAKIYGIKGVAT